jgi:hypothetical protein
MYEPVKQAPAQDYIFTHNDTTLTIPIDGSITIDGNARDAAKALFNYVLEKMEYLDSDRTIRRKEKLTFIRLNKVMLSLDKKIVLFYPLVKNDKPAPEEFFQLKIEFDKLTRLLVFI